MIDLQPRNDLLSWPFLPSTNFRIGNKNKTNMTDTDWVYLNYFMYQENKLLYQNQAKGLHTRLSEIASNFIRFLLFRNVRVCSVLS